MVGKGVYPTAKETPWPAHPNTLSFVEMVFADEVTDADRAGKETPLLAMGRLSADVRDGVLGKTKATYFDQGLLGQGAIRSPLRAVNARLERQGKVPDLAPLRVVDNPAMKIHPEALPNAEKVTIKDEKFSKYALDPQSPDGQHKAVVFKSMLGFDLSNYGDLITQIRQGALLHPAELGLPTGHGQRCTVNIPVQGPSGKTADVTTGWIVRAGTDVQDLVTAYIKTKGVQK
jgi:hypothetical protein